MVLDEDLEKLHHLRITFIQADLSSDVNHVKLQFEQCSPESLRIVGFAILADDVSNNIFHEYNIL